MGLLLVTRLFLFPTDQVFLTYFLRNHIGIRPYMYTVFLNMFKKNLKTLDKAVLFYVKQIRCAWWECFTFHIFLLKRIISHKLLTKCEVMFLVVSYSVILAVMSGPETLSHGKLGRVGGSHKKAAIVLAAILFLIE